MSAGASGPQFGERAEYGPDDICFLHPDRPTFTLCQRCGRSICPECQHYSPVGVLCTECLRHSQPSALTRTGRSTRVAARRATDAATPIVTYSLMALCVLVFGAQLLAANVGDDEVTRALWYAPLYSLPQLFEPWRMLTAMFTHSTSFLLHILFNMFALWVFGRNLELIVGRVTFLVLYLFSGIGGSLAVMMWVYADLDTLQVATVGASGAIFGLFAATLVAVKAANVNVTSLAVLIGINFAIGFLPGAAISWQSHLGGMIVGAATMGILLVTRGPRRRRARVTALSALGVVLVALTGLYFVLPPIIVPW